MITESLTDCSSCNDPNVSISKTWVNCCIACGHDEIKTYLNKLATNPHSENHKIKVDVTEDLKGKDDKGKVDGKKIDNPEKNEFEGHESDEEEPEKDDEAEHNEPEDHGVCKVIQGSHFKTFDNKIYAIIGSCDFTLVSDRNSEVFEVQLTTTLTAKSNVAMKRVTIFYASKKIDLEDKYVKVNNRIINLPYRLKGKLEILKKHGDTMVHLKNEMKISWNYPMGLLEVLAPKSFKNKLSGLCGNFDFKSSNDLTTREGILVEDPSIFAQSWSVGEEICLDAQNIEIEDCDTHRNSR